MAYNPYPAINKIYGFKKQWVQANDSGDTKAKNDAAVKARAYYEQLRRGGYGDIADELTESGLAKSEEIKNKWAKTGKTPTRDYLYSLGRSKGMSQSDVDKLIGWDNLTGEVSFGGKKIGAPDTIVDGVSYWSDTSALDNAFNDYIDRSGTTRSKSTAVNQENEKLFSKYNKEYEDLKSTNPFETETGRAILAKYDLAGLQGRDNAVASEAGSNGGNIDSFAAANALRQQSALINQGQMAALEAYQQKLEHARNLLSDMGVNIDRVHNQDEASKNNDVTRKSEIASVTGYTPDEWVVSNNPYMNDDGTLKDEYKNVDFATVMKKAKAAGNTDAYKAAAVARYYKIMGNSGAYGKYDDGDYIAPGAQKTETARQFDEQIAQADRALNAEKDNNAAERQNKLDQITTAAQYSSDTGSASTSGTAAEKPILTAAQAANAVKNGEKSQSVIDAYNYYYGTNYTVDNPPRVENSAQESETLEGALNNLYETSSANLQRYIRDKLEPLLTENNVTETELRNHIINNSKEYGLSAKDIKDICEALGVDAKWVDGSKGNMGLFWQTRGPGEW